MGALLSCFSSSLSSRDEEEGTGDTCAAGIQQQVDSRRSSEVVTQVEGSCSVVVVVVTVVALDSGVKQVGFCDSERVKDSSCCKGAEGLASCSS